MCGSRSTPAWADVTSDIATSNSFQETARDTRQAAVCGDEVKRESSYSVGGGGGAGGSLALGGDGNGDIGEGGEAQHAEIVVDASTTAKSGLSKDEQQLVG